MNKRTLIIAEAGINHNGSLKIAKKLVDEAKKAGADIVKFQTFNPDKLVTRSAIKAKYQLKYTSKKETQYQMLKKLMLTTKMHKELIKYCKKKKIEFLSTAFDNESLKMLIKLGIKRIKIPSGEINNRQLLEFAGKQKLPIILSTGMSYLNEVVQAIKIITKSGTPKLRITVLHCTTEYPLPLKEVNLLAMKSIERKLKISTGYSDHTLGTNVPIAAVALGAKIIEKHFTLSRSLIGPDHKSSLEPNELKLLVKSIRNIEMVLGKEIKAPTRTEIKNKITIRKSLVALKPINKGDILTKHNVGAKRPGSGISPMRIYEIIGTRAKRNFALDELIK
jgi:N,N'-diacetyllegionaminate synthase